MISRAMNATLIPFLIATQLLNYDERSHKYGPEYNFLMKYDTHLLLNSPAFSTQVIVNTTIYPFCQSKLFDNLRCRFDYSKNVLRIKTKLSNGTVVDDVSKVSTNLHNLERIPFELKFSVIGVETIVTPEDWIAQNKTGFLKMLANLLSVGMDFSGILDGTFRARERISGEKCITNYNLQRSSRSFKGDSRSGIGNFELFLNFPEETTNDDFYLAKHVDLATCLGRPELFNMNINNRFANNDSSDIVFNNHTVVITAKQFISQMQVKRFAILTKERSVATSTAAFTEDYSLSLKGINLARYNLPEVRNPVSTPFIITKQAKQRL